MDKINAALIFFTRLPIWKMVNPPQPAYRDVVVYWPFVGWITGGVTALVMLGLGLIMPWNAAIVIALVTRLLITGGLHEDGLADFCDGFGCGGDRSRILEIMKDSHIGTYGVIGLIFYFLLLFGILSSLPVLTAVFGFLAGDAFSKFCAGQLTNWLPYARPEGAKNGISYRRMSLGKLSICYIGGIVPLTCTAIVIGWEILLALPFPMIAVWWTGRLMKKKIGGYTGDCCGAAFSICETSFLVGVAIMYG